MRKDDPESIILADLIRAAKSFYEQAINYSQRGLRNEAYEAHDRASWLMGRITYQLGRDVL